MSEPERTLRKFPESNTGIPARYARAYAWHKSAYPQKALTEVEALLATNPDDPYFLELEGQVLLESGRPEEAIPPLRRSEEHTSELQSLMRISYAVFCLKKKKKK